MDIWDLFIEPLLQNHSNELLILLLAVFLVMALVILVPQLLRHSQRKAEMVHQERMRALEAGLQISPEDERARLAGRTALLVPMVVMISAGTVTSFLVVYKSENIFPVSLGIWVVAGVVSLAAITGGVSLIGRLAQIESGIVEEEEEFESSDFS